MIKRVGFAIGAIAFVKAIAAWPIPFTSQASVYSIQYAVEMNTYSIRSTGAQLALISLLANRRQSHSDSASNRGYSLKKKC
jgi:hypothetical protein